MNISKPREAGMVSPASTLIVVTIVQFLTPFMFSAVGVALPVLGREFQANAVHLGMIEMVYILGVALFLLPMGRFADIYGRWRVFVAGTAGITLATLALSLAPNIEWFILFRFLQGTSAAMIVSTSYAILASVFPPDRRGQATGVVVSGVYFGLSAGPTLAGLMITYLGWRWIFYTAVPVELAALVITLLKLRGEWADARGKRFDWLGSAIYMAALFGLVVGVTQLSMFDAAKWLALAGLAGLVCFLCFEARIESPILDMRLLSTNRTFTFSNIATGINYAASFGVAFLFSIYLQVIKGLAPETTGFILITQPIVQAIIAPISGRLADRYSPAKIATFGMALCTIGLSVAALLTASTPLGMIYVILVLLGLGFGFFSTPNTTAVMGSVTPLHYGVASSMLATMRSMGMLTSMTIMTFVLALFMGSRPVTAATGPFFIRSMHTSLIVFSLMSLLGIIFSLGRITPAAGK